MKKLAVKGVKRGKYSVYPIELLDCHCIQHTTILKLPTQLLNRQEIILIKI